MKAKRLVLFMVTLFLLGGVISAEAAIPSSLAAGWPWTVEEFDEDESGVVNLSTTFVGQDQFPMLSYSKVGSDRIYQAYLAPSASYHDCGPDDAWACASWWHDGLDPNSLSNVVTRQIDADTFSVMWAYRVGYKIIVATMTYKNDMTLWSDTWEEVVDLLLLPGSLKGAPSLQFVDGHVQMAFTTDTGSDIWAHSLIYMHYSGVTNNSCLTGSKYQCDFIESAVGENTIGAPSLQVSPDDEVGIAYQYKGDLKYAYPWDITYIFSKPANCGPDGDTWRCIFIFEPASGNVGDVVKQAIGLSNINRGIAYKYNHTFGDALMAAEYVGSGGNCGIDGKNFSTFEPIYTWQCSDVDNIVYNPSASFSIAMDPEGYPLIAYDNTSDDLSPTSLYLGYPEARIGESSDDYMRQTIDPAPHGDVHVGGGAALALNKDGFGFIAYRVDDGYHLTEPLKIALQQANYSYLPTIFH